MGEDVSEECRLLVVRERGCAGRGGLPLGSRLGPSMLQDPSGLDAVVSLVIRTGAHDPAHVGCTAFKFQRRRPIECVTFWAVI